MRHSAGPVAVQSLPPPLARLHQLRLPPPGLGAPCCRLRQDYPENWQDHANSSAGGLSQRRLDTSCSVSLQEG